jgi:hypothetical protein
MQEERLWTKNNEIGGGGTIKKAALKKPNF